MEYHDDVIRFFDAVQLHFLADPEQASNSWIAVRLADGSTDGDLYDTRADAIRHQPNEHLCFYIKLPPTGMGKREAEAVLRVNRGLSKMGMRLADPDRELVMPARSEHLPGNLLINPPDPSKFLELERQLREEHFPHMSPVDRQWWENEFARVKGLFGV